MFDRVVEGVNSGQLNQSNISFGLLRQCAGEDLGLFDNLGRGRAILKSPDELDQYLFSYGLMTKSQWDNTISGFDYCPEPTQIIDYGCGQGLGTAILFDHFGEALTRCVKKIVLIEPSLVALRRAQAILSCYCPDAEIVTINKRMDNVHADELGIDGQLVVHHVFSNVLDISSFNHIELLYKMFKKNGQHVVLAVSSDREFHGGSARICELNDKILDPNSDIIFEVSTSDINRFEHRNMRAISWFLNGELQNGFV